MISSSSLAADPPSSAQQLVLPIHFTPRLRSFTLHPRTPKPHHCPRHPESTTTITSRLRQYHHTYHTTKQNQRRAPFASQRLRERHPSSTSITSHLSQKRVTYPNDERVRNTATRRAADKVKRHVPDYSRVYNGELTSETLQPCRLRSAMWHLHSQPCVRSGIDLSSTSTSCNMRHSLTNQLTQVISNPNPSCTGPDYLIANSGYFLDSISLLEFVSIMPFSFDLLYICLLNSPRYDDFVLISIMPISTSIPFLPMLFKYAFKITLLLDSFLLRIFEFGYKRSISYLRSQRHTKYLSICWSLCLKTKFHLKEFHSKSFQDEDFDSKTRIKRVGESLMDLRFTINTTTSSHGFKPIMFPVETSVWKLG